MTTDSDRLEVFKINIAYGGYLDGILKPETTNDHIIELINMVEKLREQLAGTKKE